MGKFVGAYLNNLADTHAPKIHKRISNDRSVDDGLRMGAIPDHFDKSIKGYPMPKGMVAIHMVPAMKPIAVAAVAKPSPSPSAEDAKKKKKKEDEEKAKKVAEATKNANSNLNQQPIVARYMAPQNNYNNMAYAGAIAMPAAPAAAAQAAPVTATPPVKAPAPVTPTAPATNITYWTNLLVNQPTATEMQQFTTLYSSGKVTEAQYFTVMNAMAKSSVVESRTLLVQALTSIKKTESFKILSDLSATDSDSGVRSSALQAVDSYNNISYLSILSTALSSGDVNEAINGAAVIQVIAQNSQQNMTAATQSLFKPFVQLLEPLTQSTNASLRQYATQALTSVEAIVGTSVAGN